MGSNYGAVDGEWLPVLDALGVKYRYDLTTLYVVQVQKDVVKELRSAETYIARRLRLSTSDVRSLLNSQPGIEYVRSRINRQAHKMGPRGFRSINTPNEEELLGELTLILAHRTGM